MTGLPCATPSPLTFGTPDLGLEVSRVVQWRHCRRGELYFGEVTDRTCFACELVTDCSCYPGRISGETDRHTSEVMSGGCGFVYLRLLLFSIVYVYVNVLMMIMMTFPLSVDIKYLTNLSTIIQTMPLSLFLLTLSSLFLGCHKASKAR